MSNDTLAPAKPPLFDFDSPAAKENVYLTICGIMIMLPTAYLGAWFTATLISPVAPMPILGGLSFVCVVGGFMGFFRLLVQNAVREVNIKIVEEK
jgi:hypothetical protein